MFPVADPGEGPGGSPPPHHPLISATGSDIFLAKNIS